MIKNICIISQKYPSDKMVVYTFLEQLVNKFSDYDINCYVISPQSITKSIVRKIPIYKRKYYRYNENNKKVTVFCPYYLTFSNHTKIINTHYINLFNFRIAAERVFKKLNKKIKFDFVYAQFIYPAAIAANKIGQKYNIPVFFSYGEDTDYSIQHLGKEKTKKLLKGISGVISVSKSNKDRLLINDIVNEELIAVFPNGINNKIFYKKNKYEMRVKLGYSKKDFIVIFVGRFVETKGINRLCDALNEMHNDNIKAIFIGSGEIIPNYKNTLFKGSLNHNKISDYLSASDVFVLPTRAEGCSNSIIEALVSGLPIISSNKSFNDEILNDKCSIRINEMDVTEIKNAIEDLYFTKVKRIKYR